MKVLHIIASPRGDDATSLRIAKVFLDALAQQAEVEVDELYLSSLKLPGLTYKAAQGKYQLLSGKPLSSGVKGEWENLEDIINRFLSANMYVISTPMWNLSIPYTLKHYIDIIVQPSYTFKYTDKGPIGLVRGKRMALIATRGGVYQKELASMDFQTTYIKAIFGFIGITDIREVVAEGLDAFGEDEKERRVNDACAKAKELATAIIK